MDLAIKCFEAYSGTREDAVDQAEVKRMAWEAEHPLARIIPGKAQVSYYSTPGAYRGEGPFQVASITVFYEVEPNE